MPQIGSTFMYSGRKPLDARQQCDSLELLQQNPTNILYPPNFKVYCLLEAKEYRNISPLGEEPVWEECVNISVSTGLQLSHDRPEGARAWIVPTFENSDEFNYIDEWVQNKKFIADNDRAIWVASDNEGTSVNENKMMLKNVKTLTITNNTGTDLAYFCYFKKLDGILAYQGSSVKANSTATVYCTNKDEQIYENVKLYIKGLISTGDISVTANY